MRFNLPLWRKNASHGTAELAGNRIWLDYENYTVNVKSWASNGRVGQYNRNAGIGYVDETLLHWPSFALSGVTLISASLDVTLVSVGANPVSASTLFLYEQDDTIPSSWSTPNARFDDFSVTVPWTSTLGSISLVTAPGNYTFTDGGNVIRNYVQTWINNPSNNWGMILTINYNTTIYTLGVSDITLNLEW